MRLRWLAGVVLIAAGCTPTAQERVRAYNDDGLYLFQRGDFNHARDTFQADLETSPCELKNSRVPAPSRRKRRPGSDARPRPTGIFPLHPGKV